MAGKGFFEWLNREDPWIICLQETKASPEILDESFLSPGSYTSCWSSAEKKGYSGTAVYTKTKPLSVRTMGIDDFDREGRVLALEFKDFILVNAYFPNSQEAGARLEYKLAFCNAMLDFCSDFVKTGRNVILCGDYNIAHKAIDLANPKANEGNPGYLPEEREWMDRFTGSGWTDTFRMFNPEPGQYTWWSYRMRAREKNIGWRIDYHCVNKGFSEKLKSSLIMNEVTGSDHCPVKLVLNP